MNVFIAGATGHTGVILVNLIAQRGDTPYAMVRDASKSYDFPSQTIIVEGNLEKDLKGLLDNMDVVIFAAGSGSKTGPDKTISVDQEGAKSLIDEAKRIGIQRFVMLSTRGAERPEETPESIRHYMKAKKIADEYLKDSGLEYVIVRPPRLTFEKGVGTVNATQQIVGYDEIAREDVAQFMVESIYAPNLKNTVIELGSGSTPITQAIKDWK